MNRKRGITTAVMTILLVMTLAVALTNAGPSVDVDVQITKDTIEKGETLGIQLSTFIEGIIVISIPIEAEIIHPDGTNTSITLTDSFEGYKLGNFTPTKSGDYKLVAKVLINGEYHYGTESFTVSKPDIGFSIVDANLTGDTLKIDLSVNADLTEPVNFYIYNLEDNSLIPICKSNCTSTCTIECEHGLDIDRKTYQVLATVEYLDEGYTDTEYASIAEAIEKDCNNFQIFDSNTYYDINFIEHISHIEIISESYYRLTEQVNGSFGVLFPESGKYKIISWYADRNSACIDTVNVTNSQNLSVSKNLPNTIIYDPLLGQIWIKLDVDSTYFKIEDLKTEYILNNITYALTANESTKIDFDPEVGVFTAPVGTEDLLVKTTEKINYDNNTFNAALKNSEITQKQKENLILMDLVYSEPAAYRYSFYKPENTTIKKVMTADDRTITWYDMDDTGFFISRPTKAVILYEDLEEQSISLNLTKVDNKTYEGIINLPATLDIKKISTPAFLGIITINNKTGISDSGYFVINKLKSDKLHVTISNNQKQEPIILTLSVSDATQLNVGEPTINNPILPNENRSAGTYIKGETLVFNKTYNDVYSRAIQNISMQMFDYTGKIYLKKSFALIDSLKLTIPESVPEGDYVLLFSASDYNQVLAHDIFTIKIASDKPSISISSGTNKTGAPGELVTFVHTVTNNNLKATDIIELAVISNLTNITVFKLDGEDYLQLRDNNDNQIIDTGIILPGKSVDILVDVQLSGSIPPGINPVALRAYSNMIDSQAESLNILTVATTDTDIPLNYNDLDMYNFGFENSTISLEIHNNDLLEKDVEVSIKAINDKGEFSTTRKVNLDKNIISSITEDIGLNAEPIYMEAELIDGKGDYIDDDLSNNFKSYVKDSTWRLKEKTHRIKLDVNERSHNEHYGYSIRYQINLSGMDPSTITIIYTDFEDGKFIQKEIGYKYLSYDPETMQGYILIPVSRLAANRKLELFLYYNPGLWSNQMIERHIAEHNADNNWNPERIIDNRDPEVKIIGKWHEDYQSQGYYGADYLHDLNMNKGENLVIYQPMAETSSYEVYYKGPTDSSFSDKTPIKIIHTNGETTFNINQKKSLEEWTYLGLYDLDEKSEIIVSNTLTDQIVVADAFKLIKVSEFISMQEPEVQEGVTIDVEPIEPVEDKNPDISIFNNETLVLNLSDLVAINAGDLKNIKSISVIDSKNIFAYLNLSELIITPRANYTGTETIVIQIYDTVDHCLNLTNTTTIPDNCTELNTTVNLNINVSAPVILELTNASMNLTLNATINATLNLTMNDTLNSTINASVPAGPIQSFDFPDVVLAPNNTASLNLSLYFQEENLTFEIWNITSTYNATGVAYTLNDSVLKIHAEDNSTGNYSFIFSASDGINTTLSNTLKVIITDKILTGIADPTEPVNETIIQHKATVDSPVIWEKQITVTDERNINLPREASAVEIVAEGKNKTKVNETRIKVKLNGKNITLSELDELNELRKLKIKGKEAKKEREETSFISGLGINKLRKLVAENKIEDNISDMETDVVQNIGITEIAEEKIKLEVPENGTYTITYETDAPKKTEEIGEDNLEVFVYSNVTIHYHNIFANATIPEEIGNLPNVSLYHWRNGTKYDVTLDTNYNVTFYDMNNDSIIDYVEWIVPQLSGQLFVVGEGAGAGVGIARATRSTPNTVATDTNVTVTLTIYNRGDKTLENLTLYDIIPSSFTNFSPMVLTSGTNLVSDSTDNTLANDSSLLSSQKYTTEGADTFTVPTSTSHIQLKVWGAGGGGGGPGDVQGGGGAGGGFAQGNITFSDGDTLDIRVGGDGKGGADGGNEGEGGGGAGYSAVLRTGTLLIMAGGGGAGGGASESGPENGGGGGAGSGANANNGLRGTNAACGGGIGDNGDGATTAAAGAGGSGCSGAPNGEAGDTDGQYEGGDGGDSDSGAGDANLGVGGTYGGGAGGNDGSNREGAGGGGGGGYHGGGGGESGRNEGGGGGGGGSGYTTGLTGVSTATGTNGTTGGNGGSAANTGDSDYVPNAGNGGAGGTNGGTGANGEDGLVVINYVAPKIDVNSGFITYSDIATSYLSVTGINITIEVDSYNPEASVNVSSNYPDVELQVNNGTDWLVVDNFSLTSVYTTDAINKTNANFTISVTDADTLAAWQDFTKQDYRIRAVSVDKVNEDLIDEINITNSWASIGYTAYALEWNISKIYPDESTQITYKTQAPGTSQPGAFGFRLYHNGSLIDSDTHSIFVSSEGAMFMFDITSLNASPLINVNNTFLINVTNIGSTAIQAGDMFTVELPSQFTITDAGSGSQSSQSIRYTFTSSLAVGASITQNFTASAIQGGGYNFTVYGITLSSTTNELADSFSQDISGAYTTEQNNNGLTDVITENDVNAGIGHANGGTGSPVYFWQDFGFNLTHLGITGDQIYNFTFQMDTCWSDNDVAPACDTNDQPMYTLAANTYVHSGTQYIAFGPTVNIPSGASNPDLNNGDYFRNHSKVSGFSAGYINGSGFLNIRINTSGTLDSTSDDAHMGTDYVKLDLYYNSNNFTQDIFVRIYDNTSIGFISREVPSISASLTNVTVSITVKNIYNDTAVKINLTEAITNISCDDPTSRFFKVFSGEAYQGEFDSVTVDTANRVITWYGLELQVNEQITVNYTVQTPTCGVETMFTDAFNATVEWYDLRNISKNSTNNQNTRVAAYNRAFVDYWMSPGEISKDHEVTQGIVINSSGMRPITALTNVSLILPDNCSIDLGSISDSGTYNAIERKMKWTTLGALPIGNSKTLSFDITCNKSGTVSYNVTSIYSDLVGELNTTAPVTASVIDITQYITRTWSPSLIEPSGSSTITVGVNNPYTSGTMSTISITPLIPSNWTINPNSQSIASLTLSDSASRQFLVNANSTVANYYINTTVSFVDPNSVTVTVNVTDYVQVASTPNLVIIREMAPVFGNESQDMTVRLFIYNNGNDLATNVNITEYVNDSFWNGNGNVVTVYDGGVSDAGNDIIYWEIGNITSSNYSLVKYTMEYDGTIPLITPKIYEISGDTSGWPYDFSGGSWNSTDATTYGISEAVDGWDQNENTAAYDNNEDCTFTNNAGYLQANDGGNEIQVGCSFGININITHDIYQQIERGGTVNISFYYYLGSSNNVETEDQSWIKARWHSPTSGEHYLGSSLDDSMNGKDNTYEIVTSNDDPDTGDPYTGTHNQNITSWIEGVGMYYLDLGHKGEFSTSSEDATSRFDNINIIISGPKIYKFKSSVNYTDISDVKLSANESAFTGVRENWGSLSFNLTDRIFNVSQSFNNTLETFNVGGRTTDENPKLKLVPTTTYDDSESVSSYTSGTRTITYTEGLIASLGQVDNWFVINSSVADYHVLHAHGLTSSSYSEQLFILSKSGDLSITIVEPPENHLVYQGDFFNVTANATAENGNIVGCTLTILPPGFATINGSGSVTVGDLTPSTSAEPIFNLTGTDRGYDSFLISGTCTAGTSAQNTVMINISYAIQMNRISIPHTELEAGDTIFNITVNSTNLGERSHDINTTIDIFNIAKVDQNFGPANTETITNSTITQNSHAIAVFDNSGSGYTIPSSQAKGKYFINATSQPATFDSLWINTSFEIIEVSVWNSLNTSLVEPGEDIFVAINVSNGWSSVVRYETNITVTYEDTSTLVTDDWTFNPALPTSQNIASQTNDSFQVVATSPSNLLAARAGLYTINISINYTDPNGQEKTKYTAATLNISKVYNFTVNLTVPSRAPIGLDSIFNVTVTNIGNCPLTDLNSSMIVRDNLGADPGYTVTPGVDLLDITFNSSTDTQFTLSVTNSATPGEYNATAMGNHSTVSANDTKEFNVTRDISITSVRAEFNQYEAGDTIDYYNITVSSSSPSLSYYVTARTGTYNSSNERQSFSPNSTEVTNSVVNALQTVNLLLQNSSSGYHIPSSTSRGNYTIIANVTSNGSVVTYENGSVEVVIVNVSSSTNVTSIDYDDDVLFNVSILNNFSSGITFTLLSEAYDNTSINRTSSWTITTNKLSSATSAKSTSYFNINMTPTSPSSIEYGNHTLKGKVTYTDPNSIAKTKYTNNTVYINPYKNITASASIPTFTTSEMTIGVANLIIVKITNIGNIGLKDINISLEIFNSSSTFMPWTMTPGNWTLQNVSYGTSEDTEFTVVVPSGTKAGNYSVNISIFFDGTDTAYYNLTKNFTVSETVYMNITPSQMEVEPLDTLDNISVNITNINPNGQVFNVTSHMEIYDPSNTAATWGPPISDTKTTTNLAQNDSVVITWNNATNGYQIDQSTPYGEYLIQALGNITNVGTTVTFMVIQPKFKVVRVNGTSTLSSATVDVGGTVSLNATINNGFNNQIEFNISEIKIINSSGADLTSLWTIDTVPKGLNVDSVSLNSTLINITAPTNAMDARAGTYTIKCIFNYTDVNGREKNRSFTSSVTVNDYKKVVVNITNPTELPIALNATFTVNITNIGNTGFNSSNVTLIVEGQSWTITPESKLLTVDFGETNTTTFKVLIPGTADTATTYTANATASTGQYSTINHTTFSPSQYIYTKNINLSYTEAEPGTTVGLNATVLNNLGSQDVSVNENITIYDPSSSIVSWTPADAVGTAIANTETAIDFTAISVPTNAATGNYTVKVDTLYGYLGNDTNSTRLTVSTVSGSLTSDLFAVEPNETAVLTLTATNGWFSQGFTGGGALEITLMNITNSSADDLTANWTMNATSALLDVGAKASASVSFTANTSVNLVSGYYNFTFQINYTDPNTGSTITKYVSHKLGLMVDNINANFTFPSQMLPGNSYDVNASLINIGSNMINETSVTVFLKKSGTSYSYFTPSSWTVYNISKSATNTTLVNMTLLLTMEPGVYNATMNTTFKDSLGLYRNEVRYVSFTITPKIDIDILAAGKEHALLEPDQTVTIRIHVEDYADNALSGATVNATIWTFDNNNYSLNGVTNGAGNLDTSLTLSQHEAGYYVNVTVNYSDSPLATKEAVIITDNNKTVLVVKDDNSVTQGNVPKDLNDQEFETALNSVTAINITTTLHTISTDGVPTALQMSAYDAVVWSLGNSLQNTITESNKERENLTAYLSTGGGLVIESELLTYDVFLSLTEVGVLRNITRTENPGVNPRITTIQDDSVTTIESLYNHPLNDGFGGQIGANYTVYDAGTGSSFYKDKVIPNTTDSTRAFAKWDSPNTQYAGTYSDFRSENQKAGERIVYYPYAIDGLSSGIMEKAILNSVFWAMKKKFAVIPRCTNTSVQIHDWDNSDTVNIEIYAKDYDAYDVSGLSSGSTINTTVYGTGGMAQSFTVNSDANHYNVSVTFNRTGTNIVNISAYKQGHYKSYGYCNITVYELVPPMVKHHSPVEDYNTTTHALQLFFNASDTLAAVPNCTLYLNDAFNQTNTTISETEPNRFNVNLVDGNYNWSIACSDTYSNTNQTTNRKLKVDSTAPTITIHAPTNGEKYTTTSNKLVNATITDALSEIDLVIFEYRRNVTDVWKNICNRTATPYNCSWDISSLPDGARYQVRIKANDTLGNNDSESVTGIRIDTNPPTLIVWSLNISNGTNVTRNNHVLAYSQWTDVFNLSTARIEHNGSGTLTNYSISIADQQTVWANYTLDTSDTTEFNHLGRVLVRTIHVNDTSGNEIYATPTHDFYLWGRANVTAITPSRSTVFSTEVMKVTCRVQDDDTRTDVEGMTVSIYRNSTLLGTNTTDSAGLTKLSFNTTVTGRYNITCNVTNETSIYYRSGDQPEMSTLINVIPFNITPTSPANGISLDRDGYSATVSDSTVLQVRFSENITYANLTFYANVTEPAIGQTNIFLGYNDTIGPGVAKIAFDPNSTIHYAGNYTWWANATYGINNGTRHLKVYGSFNVTYINDTFNPNSTYNAEEYVAIQSIAESNGPESTDNLNQSYNSLLNTTFIDSNSGKHFMELVYNGTAWNDSFQLHLPTLGQWNVTVNGTADYFFFNLSDQRSFTVYAPTFAYSPTNGTQVDRDSFTASVSDNITLIINVSGISGETIYFYANLTEPITQDDISLGSAVSNSSGLATLKLNPASTMTAGNYTWWGNNTYATPRELKYFELYGAVNITFNHTTIHPNATYLTGETIIVDAEMKSYGSETEQQLNDSFLALANMTLIPPTATEIVRALSFNNTSWRNDTYTFPHSSERGLWNVSLNNSADYFYSNGIGGRGFTLYLATNLTIWDQVDTWKIAKVFDQINFSANYTTLADLPINETCTIYFTDGSAAMIYNQTGDETYFYQRNFTSVGTLDWNVSCTGTYYQSQVTLDTVRINKTDADVTAPANGTEIDRDSMNAIIQDSIQFISHINNAPAGITISFYANRTEPTTANPILIGSNSTNSSGHAVYNYDPASSVTAGNYTIFANATVANIRAKRYYHTYGGLEVVFNSTTNPAATYNTGDTITIDATLNSLGTETENTLNDSYNAAVNSTLDPPTAADLILREIYTGSYWRNNTYTFPHTAEPGIWNVILNSTADYFYKDGAASRTFILNISTNLSIWDQADIGTDAKVYENINFTANYTTLADIPVNKTCTIYFHDGVTDTMTFNATGNNLHTYIRNFTSTGTFTWNVTCSEAYYQPQFRETTVRINKTDADVTTPSNGTDIDRDGVSVTVSDTATLVGSLPYAPAGVTVNFYATQTEPSTGTAYLLGSNTTNASGEARLTFNPASAVTAGNYTAFVNSTYSNARQKRYYHLYGGLVVVFNSTSNPTVSYNTGDTIIVDATLNSLGDETENTLNDSYNGAVNATLQPPTATEITLLENYTGDFWRNDTYSFPHTSERGIWDVILNSTAEYFFKDGVNARTFILNLSTNLTIWDQTDIGKEAKIYEPVNFTANYTTLLDVPVNGSCTIYFSDGSAAMVYNQTGDETYYYQRNFSGVVVLDWNVSCTGTYYQSQVRLDTVKLNKTDADVVAPTNGTVVDRDSVSSTSPDSIQFIGWIPYAPAGVTINFFMNRTEPTSAGPISIGSNTTNSSGHAVFTYNPASSTYAGNYTVFVNATVANIRAKRYHHNYGGLNLAYLNLTKNPNSTYVVMQTMLIDANLTSLGSETPEELNDTYGAKLNATLIQADLTTHEIDLNFTAADYWNGTHWLNTSNFGYWNISINATADYFFEDSVDFRDFIVKVYLYLLSPTNSFTIDRDSVSAIDPDTVKLIINFSGVPGENITFWMNLTDPDLGQTNLNLGTNLTNASGMAVWHFTNATDYYAGNYTWWASHVSPFSELESSKHFVSKGGLDMEFTYNTVDPNLTYQHNRTILIKTNISSQGIESDAQLETNYGFGSRITSFMTSPSKSTTKETLMSRLATRIYNSSIFITVADEKGLWNITVKANATYFYETVLNNRYVNITKFWARLNLWDQYDTKGGTIPAYQGATASYYANYTSNKTGYPVNPANCTFNFDDSSSGFGNYTSGIYRNISKIFMTPGNHRYNAICNSSLYETKTAYGIIRIYPRTNASVTKTIEHAAKSNMNATITTTNYAPYNDQLDIYDFIYRGFTSYAYDYGPNASTDVDSNRFKGNSTYFNVTINSGSTNTISYRFNGTDDYNISDIYIIGLG